MVYKKGHKSTGGRPKLDLDVVQIRELASMDCTMDEIASVLRCSVDTLHNNYSAYIKEGRESGRASVRKAQFDVAVKKHNPTMLIWLGKIRLGQREIDLDEQSQKGDVQEICNTLKELVQSVKNEQDTKPQKDLIPESPKS